MSVKDAVYDENQEGVTKCKSSLFVSSSVGVLVWRRVRIEVVRVLGVVFDPCSAPLIDDILWAPYQTFIWLSVPVYNMYIRLNHVATLTSLVLPVSSELCQK